MNARRNWELVVIAIAAVVVGLPNIASSLLADDWSLLLAGRHAFEGNWLAPFTGAWVWETIAPDWPYYDYFRPFIVISFGLDDLIWGGAAFGFHLTNVLIHLVCCFGVYAIARQLDTEDGSYFPCVAGVLFALHPIHEYSVLWISGRTDTLCAAFYLWAFYAAMRYTREGRWGWCVCAGFLAAGALCSKEMAYTLPIAFALWSVLYVRGDSLRRAGIAVVSLVGTCGVFAAYRVLLFGGGSAFSGAEGGLSSKFRTLFDSARHLSLPFHISFREHIYLVVIIGVCVLIVAGLLRHRFANRHLVFALGWILVTLLPVMNLYMPWYMYIPSVGFCLGVAWVLTPIERNVGIARVALGVVIVAYAVQFGMRSFVWREASEIADAFVVEYDETFGDGEEVALISVPGSIGDVPVYAHNLAIRLRLELGDETIDPVILAFAELPVALEDQRLDVVQEEENVYRLSTVTDDAFIMPGGDEAWGRRVELRQNGLGVATEVRVIIDDPRVLGLPHYNYERGEFVQYGERGRE